MVEQGTGSLLWLPVLVLSCRVQSWVRGCRFIWSGFSGHVDLVEASHGKWGTVFPAWFSRVCLAVWRTAVEKGF